MEEMNDVIIEATHEYFYNLAVNGYKKDADVIKLLVLQFLGELINGGLSFYISEEDYRAIDKALYCIYGSNCFIPYPQYEINQNIIGWGDASYLPRKEIMGGYRSSRGYPVRITKQ